MKISERVKEMQFSPIRKLAPYAQDAVRKGVKVYHLNIGQPDVQTPVNFFDGVRGFNEKVLKYTDSQGVNTLLDSFIKYYKKFNIDFEKDEMIVTNGGSEAIIFTLIEICDPGEEVLIPEPFYTNYNGFANAAGVNVVPFLTKAEDGFHLPKADVIEEKVTNKTRAILVSNPGNPTGVVYTHDELRMLADIAKKHDLYLIVDEAYREFVYDNLEYTSALYLKDAVDRVILIDSVSKRYSACGARIGVVASKNKEFMHQMLKLGQVRLCVPTIEQFGALNLINTPDEYFKKVKEEYEERRDILYSGLCEIEGVMCKKPTGAFYIMAKLPVDDAEVFSKWMLTDFSYENKTVMVAPAAGFYCTKGLGKDEVRISYCINKESLKDAVKILKIGIEKYNSL